MNAINQELRTAILSRMVSKTPGQVLGRTQVMKLFYFLQELEAVRLGYDFRLFTYGPFDSEVLSDLATACSQKAVSEETVIYARGYGYEITPNQFAGQLSRELEKREPTIASKVDKVLDEFGSFGAAELELRSTIFFIDRELVQARESTTASSLADRVRQVKPHFTDSTILNRIQEMRNNGWLKSV